MSAGFLLFVDEAGEEGLESVRPLDPNGSSEYFCLVGVLIRTSRYPELVEFIKSIREELHGDVSRTIHFRDLTEKQKILVVEKLKLFKFSVFCIISNKRNMRGYRNKRIERTNYEIVRGRQRPKASNWFYNHTFRYLMEAVSAECAYWSPKAYGCHRPVRVVFAERKTMSYSQTRAYFYKLRMQPRDKRFYNNKNQIDWRVVNYRLIDSMKPKNEPGLQLADCVASMIYRAIDEDNFGTVEPDFLAALAGKFGRSAMRVAGFSFKLLPDPFPHQLSNGQRLSLSHVGYRL